MTRKKKRKIGRYMPLYLMMILPLTYLLINNYIPMAGVVIAFKNVNFKKGIFGSDWAGLSNFKFLFMTQDAWIITRNTVLYNVAFISSIRSAPWRLRLFSAKCAQRSCAGSIRA